MRGPVLRGDPHPHRKAFSVSERFGVLGDRLLSLVVPRARAAAVGCWYEYLPIAACYRRYCCDGRTLPGIQCTPYRAC